VYLGLGLRLGSGTFAGYDADAAAYFDRAGVTDATAKQQINAFVVGVKGLGLWSNMVCWPMRSTQNAGTGTTAYSLGGAGTYNGTLTNGPTWGSSGIFFDGVNDVISTTLTIAGVNSSCGFVGNCPTSAAGGNVFRGLNSNSEFIYWLNPRTSFGGDYRFGLSNILIADNTLTGTHFWQVRGVTGSATKVYVDGSLLTTAGTNAAAPSPLAVSTGLQIGGNAGGYSGTMAFAVIFTSDVSSPSSLYSLYKTTLGTGLGLA
jgi:hypothetical protein